jgi:hypothetical protein
MKMKIIGTGFVSCLMLVSLSGCGHKETPPPTTGEVPAVEGATTNASDAMAAAQTAATQVKQAATQAVTQAVAEASTQTAAMASQVQGLIDKAKGLVNEQKYQDALDTLKQLGNFKLSPEQQKAVDDLKTQIQKLMSNQTVSNVVNSAGNLLGK